MTNNYLSTLKKRTKYYWEKENIKMEAMVILKEEYLRICNWSSLGQIVELFPGRDNRVRVLAIEITIKEFPKKQLQRFSYR